MSETKKIRITLVALTREEYSEVVEVPADTSPEELDTLVDRRRSEVEAGEYEKDPEYWDRGDCRWENETKNIYAHLRYAKEQLHGN